MFAAFRSGAPAVSVSPGGDTFVNAPSGRTLLSLTAGAAPGGALFGADGSLLERWDPGEAPRSPTIELQLDGHLGFRFVVAERRAEVYFAYGQVRYRFDCGTNAPRPQWAPEVGEDAPALLSALEQAQLVGARSPAKLPPPRRRPTVSARMGGVNSILASLDADLGRWMEKQAKTASPTRRSM